jgi:hypothetical protein
VTAALVTESVSGVDGFEARRTVRRMRAMIRVDLPAAPTYVHSGVCDISRANGYYDLPERVTVGPSARAPVAGSPQCARTMAMRLATVGVLARANGLVLVA